MKRLWIAMGLFATAVAIALTLPERHLTPQKLAFHFGSPSEANGPHKRVQTDLARQIESWQAKRDCASTSRARQALKPMLAQWLGTQRVAHRGRKLGAWGYHSGDVWAEDHIIDGKPICNAGFRKLIAYADFR